VQNKKEERLAHEAVGSATGDFDAARALAQTPAAAPKIRAEDTDCGSIYKVGSQPLSGTDCRDADQVAAGEGGL
jgi:hypothetical protein